MGHFKRPKQNAIPASIGYSMNNVSFAQRTTATALDHFPDALSSKSLKDVNFDDDDNHDTRERERDSSFGPTIKFLSPGRHDDFIDLAQFGSDNVCNMFRQISRDSGQGLKFQDVDQHLLKSNNG